MTSSVLARLFYSMTTSKTVFMDCEQSRIGELGLIRQSDTDKRRKHQLRLRSRPRLVDRLGADKWKGAGIRGSDMVRKYVL